MANQTNEKSSSNKKKSPKRISYSIDLTINENGLTIGQIVNTHNDSDDSEKKKALKRKASSKDITNQEGYTQNKNTNKAIHTQPNFKFNNNEKGKGKDNELNNINNKDSNKQKGMGKSYDICLDKSSSIEVIDSFDNSQAFKSADRIKKSKINQSLLVSKALSKFNEKTDAEKSKRLPNMLRGNSIPNKESESHNSKDNQDPSQSEIDESNYEDFLINKYGDQIWGLENETIKTDSNVLRVFTEGNNGDPVYYSGPNNSNSLKRCLQDAIDDENNENNLIINENHNNADDTDLNSFEIIDDFVDFNEITSSMGEDFNNLSSKQE